MKRRLAHSHRSYSALLKTNTFEGQTPQKRVQTFYLHFNQKVFWSQVTLKAKTQRNKQKTAPHGWKLILKVSSVSGKIFNIMSVMHCHLNVLLRNKNDTKMLFGKWMNVLMYLKKMRITFQTGNTLGWERKLCNDHVFTLTKIMNDYNDRELMDLPVCSLWLSKWEASYNGRVRKQNHFEN